MARHLDDLFAVAGRDGELLLTETQGFRGWRTNSECAVLELQVVGKTEMRTRWGKKVRMRRREFVGRMKIRGKAWVVWEEMEGLESLQLETP